MNHVPTSNATEIYQVENEFVQNKLCIDPGKISADIVNNITAKNECTILEQNYLFNIQFRTPHGCLVRKRFSCKICYPVNCRVMEINSTTCGLFNEMVYSSHFHYSRGCNRISIYRVGCTSKCGIFPTDLPVARAHLTYNGELDYISTK
ncbi:hypothetical protein TrispH2_007237 [Trichoplax sp. H2]|nr:hypothetical protein TrispH2_007237 [Trichoplax sp. H2]|eukprot:RDD40621.1 hypothetical protein TrispH2_007237 [Trichoplax sp. H2]